MRARLLCLFLAVIAGCSRGPEPDIKTVAPNAFEKPAEQEGEIDVGAKEEPDAAAPKPDLGRLTLPDDGGDWPLVAAKTIQAVPVPLAHLLTGSLHPHNVAISAASGRAVVSIWETDFTKKKTGTHLFWCDLTTGKVTHTWDAHPYYLAVFDIDASGRQFLLKRHDGSERERHVLHLWTVAEDGLLLRKEWEPYYAGNTPDGEPRDNDAAHIRRREADVIWAAFVGRDHVVTVCGSGELKVWERESLKQVAVITDVVGLPALTNDGERVAFVTKDRVALLDPQTRRIVAVQRIGKPPDNAVVAFRADGKRVAIAGAGKATVVNLETAVTWDEMQPELKLEYHGILPEFGWVSQHTLYFNGDLYDLPLPIKIWHYGVPHCATVRGGQVWAVTHALGENDVTLRAFTLPHPRAAQAIAGASQRRDLFVLRPGDTVRVDVAGVPQNKRQEVRDTLERRVRELGYRISDYAPTTFVASVDSTGHTVTKTYTIGKEQVTGSYDERCARLKIIQNSRVLWEEAGTDSPGMMILVPNNVDAKDYISRFGSPSYDLFSKRPLPGLLRPKGDAKPLGESQLTAGGVKEWK
jgi:hypothetical protein